MLMLHPITLMQSILTLRNFSWIFSPHCEQYRILNLLSLTIINLEPQKRRKHSNSHKLKILIQHHHQQNYHPLMTHNTHRLEIKTDVPKLMTPKYLLVRYQDPSHLKNPNFLKDG